MEENEKGVRRPRVLEAAGKCFGKTGCGLFFWQKRTDATREIAIARFSLFAKIIEPHTRGAHCPSVISALCGDGLSIVLHAVPQITRLKDTFYCALRHQDNELYNGAKKFACSKRFPVHVP